MNEAIPSESRDSLELASQGCRRSRRAQPHGSKWLHASTVSQHLQLPSNWMQHEMQCGHVVVVSVVYRRECSRVTNLDGVSCKAGRLPHQGKPRSICMHVFARAHGRTKFPHADDSLALLRTPLPTPPPDSLEHLTSQGRGWGPSADTALRWLRACCRLLHGWSCTALKFWHLSSLKWF